MQADDNRLRALRRIRRLKEIEEMEARRELADAVSQQAKHQNLRRRTAALAGEYSQQKGAMEGAQLSRSLGLAQSLSKLSAFSARQEEEADQSTKRASRKLARLENQQERLGDMIKGIEQEEEARLQAIESSLPRLARQLLKG